MHLGIFYIVVDPHIWAIVEVYVCCTVWLRNENMISHLLHWFALVLFLFEGRRLMVLGTVCLALAC